MQQTNSFRERTVFLQCRIRFYITFGFFSTKYILDYQIESFQQKFALMIVTIFYSIFELMKVQYLPNFRWFVVVLFLVMHFPTGFYFRSSHLLEKIQLQMQACKFIQSYMAVSSWVYEFGRYIHLYTNQLINNKYYIFTTYKLK